jgi:hypothetical protein
MRTAPRSTSSNGLTESALPYRGRRLSWDEFRKLVTDAANDNEARGVDRDLEPPDSRAAAIMKLSHPQNWKFD